MFDKYARRVQPLDTSAVKNVYERVWLMTEIQRQEKEKITQEKGKCISTVCLGQNFGRFAVKASY